MVVAESDAFEFVFPEQGSIAVNHVFVESGGEASVHIPIRPLVLGELPVSVEAMTSTASRYVVRTTVVKVRFEAGGVAGGAHERSPGDASLCVQAEGLEQSFSSSLLLEVSGSSLSKHATFSFPPHLVPGSARASVTVVGASAEKKSQIVFNRSVLLDASVSTTTHL